MPGIESWCCTWASILTFFVPSAWDIRTNKTWLQPSKIPRVEKYKTMLLRPCRKDRKLALGCCSLHMVGWRLAGQRLILKDRSIQRSFRENGGAPHQGRCVWLDKVCSRRGLWLRGVSYWNPAVVMLIWGYRGHSFFFLTCTFYFSNTLL